MAGWAYHYRKEWLRPDVVAGITTAAVVVPKAMAYASIAGLPVEVGLYTALVPMVIYAVLGSSRPLSVSTTSAIAILTAAQLGEVAQGANPIELVSAATTLALLVGGFLLLAGIFRMGFISNFISTPVLTGFRAGIGFIIVVDQIPKLLGVHFEKGGFFVNLYSIVRHIPETEIPTLLLALCTLALILSVEHFWPRLPAPLFAVIFGIAASGMLELGQFGVGVAGDIPVGLPTPVLPDLSLIQQLWPGALGIALMAFTESIAASRSFTRKGDPAVDANRELLALGAANIVGGFFRIVPAGGGTSQTAVNDRVGARTQLSELVTAGTVLAVLLVLAPLISLLPQATLAAVVIATTIGLINPQDFTKILRVRQTEFWWAMVAFFGVILFGTLQGILIAVVISVFTIMYYANHPPLYALRRKPGTNIFRPVSDQHPADESVAGLLIIRTEGRLNFASTPRLVDRFWEMVRTEQPRVLIIDFSAVPDIEYTALEAIINAEEKLRSARTTLWLAALNPSVLEVIRRSPLNQRLGSNRMFHTVEEAVNRYERTRPSA